MKFEFPKPGSRIAISGATGSGKTRFGVYLLSCSDLDRRPHYVLDYKGDDLIGSIRHARELGLNEIATKPGLYILRPLPHQDDAVENWLWKIWRQENCTLFCDEGYMVPNREAFNAILTQGRSKRISVFTLTQRPVYCSRFVFSEAGYIALFRLNDKRDWQTVTSFTPDTPVFDTRRVLPNFTARWYDVSRDWSSLIEPVPDDDAIRDRFMARLQPRFRSI